VSDLKPTEEQQAVIDNANDGETFVVDAVAGSGKTSTLRMAAEAMSDRRILYLVYNRAASDDAKKVFPKNVEVKTTSALAFKEYAGDYKHRLIGAPYVPARQTAKMLGINSKIQVGENTVFWPEQIARLAIDTVDNYAHSADFEVMEKHVSLRDMPLGLNEAQIALLKQTGKHWGQKLWEQAIVPASQHRFTFDYAFKLYVMAGADLSEYGAIFLDEAQDSNDIVETFLKDQWVQKVIVGDPAQQLYAWRGAVDIMGRFDGPRLPLSQSWRFGEQVAEEANKWLEHTGTKVKVKGSPYMDSVVTDSECPLPDALLCRTNASAVGRAVRYLDAGLSVAIVGGTDKLLNLAKAAGELYDGGQTTHPELVAFQSWKELVAFSEEPSGSDLKPLVNLINIHGVGAIKQICRRIIPESKEEAKKLRQTYQGDPDVVISTAHKSKGREWKKVQISDDFQPPPPVLDPLSGEKGPGPIKRADAMLHYVAITRGRQMVHRGSLDWIDDYADLPQEFQ
jgi:hypothetical protein